MTEEKQNSIVVVHVALALVKFSNSLFDDLFIVGWLDLLSLYNIFVALVIFGVSVISVFCISEIYFTFVTEVGTSVNRGGDRRKDLIVSSVNETVRMAEERYAQQFDKSWEVNYFFAYIANETICLLCGFKPSTVKNL